MPHLKQKNKKQKKLNQRLAAQVLGRLSEGPSVTSDRLFEEVSNRLLRACNEKCGIIEQWRRSIRFNSFSKRRLLRCLKQLERAQPEPMVVRMTGRGHTRVWEAYPRPHWMITDEGRRYLLDLRATQVERLQDTMARAA